MRYFPNVSINVLFPTPGTPVIPILIDFPLLGKQSLINLFAKILSLFNELSTNVIPLLNAEMFPLIISLNNFIYLIAITDISMFTFLGNLETSTNSLAGLESAKKEAYSVFIFS